MTERSELRIFPKVNSYEKYLEYFNNTNDRKVYTCYISKVISDRDSL